MSNVSSLPVEWRAVPSRYCVQFGRSTPSIRLKCLSCCQRRLQIATRPMATSRCDAPPAGKEGHVQKFPEARDSGELTLGPRSPAARNAFRNQISSLVKSKPTLAVPLRNPAATSTSGFNYAVFQPRQLYRPISLRFSSYSARSISPRARR